MVTSPVAESRAVLVGSSLAESGDEASCLEKLCVVDSNGDESRRGKSGGVDRSAVKMKVELGRVASNSEEPSRAGSSPVQSGRVEENQAMKRRVEKSRVWSTPMVTSPVEEFRADRVRSSLAESGDEASCREKLCLVDSHGDESRRGKSGGVDRSAVKMKVELGRVASNSEEPSRAGSGPVQSGRVEENQSMKRRVEKSRVWSTPMVTSPVEEFRADLVGSSLAESGDEASCLEKLCVVDSNGDESRRGKSGGVDRSAVKMKVELGRVASNSDEPSRAGSSLVQSGRVEENQAMKRRVEKSRVWSTPMVTSPVEEFQADRVRSSLAESGDEASCREKLCLVDSNGDESRRGKSGGVDRSAVKMKVELGRVASNSEEPSRAGSSPVQSGRVEENQAMKRRVEKSRVWSTPMVTSPVEEFQADRVGSSLAESGDEASCREKLCLVDSNGDESRRRKSGGVDRSVVKLKVELGRVASKCDEPSRAGSSPVQSGRVEGNQAMKRRVEKSRVWSTPMVTSPVEEFRAESTGVYRVGSSLAESGDEASCREKLCLVDSNGDESRRGKSGRVDRSVVKLKVELGRVASNSDEPSRAGSSPVQSGRVEENQAMKRRVEKSRVWSTPMVTSPVEEFRAESTGV
ncbi:hypothetical protein VNO77_23054 [Canavalia gladiata]|uniref:Uncharacterized protein n=1 Tax=Canavalia gladiata TaxID=3824 RepID=A0AAN9L3X5_CANGL